MQLSTYLPTMEMRKKVHRLRFKDEDEEDYLGKELEAREEDDEDESSETEEEEEKEPDVVSVDMVLTDPESILETDSETDEDVDTTHKSETKTETGERKVPYAAFNRGLTFFLKKWAFPSLFFFIFVFSG